MKRFTLSKDQKKILQMIIDLRSIDISTSRKELRKRLKIKDTRLNGLMMPMIRNGYVSEHPSMKGSYYIPRRKPDGAAIETFLPPKDEDGIRRYPTMYAVGYGLFKQWSIKP